MEIIKSLRKTISMSVDKTWKLIVRAPYFTSKKTIENFIEKNKTWVESRKSAILKRIKNFNEWEKFMFFWEEYELKYCENSKKIEFDWMNFYLNNQYKKDASKFFINFYKQEAKKYITERLKEIAEKYSLKYNVLKITSARGRWWSCTSKWNINFSYRLIMAPVETIDYVIIHELAHLKNMNHSKKFRLEVEVMMKWLYTWDYKIYKNWLKKYGDRLIY